MIVKETKDSILNTSHKYIAHGVNCQNAMGSGVAKVLFQKYPQVKSDYHKFIGEAKQLWVNGSEDLLGTVQFVPCDDKYVLNCFTQENYGYDGKLYVSYTAIENCFRAITDHLSEGDTIAIPKIGCGLAGGNWETVKEIIDRVTGDKINVEVYYV